MKRTSLIILFILFTICLKGQDSTNISVEKFNNLNETVLENQKTIDSLKATLNNLNVKHCFFENELSNQTTIFSVIVACILTITGFLSWKLFKYELNHYNEEMDKKIIKIDEDFKDLKNQFKIIENHVYDNSSNTSKIIADFILEKQLYYLSFKFLIYSVYYKSLVSDNYFNQKAFDKIQSIKNELLNITKILNKYQDDINKQIEALKNDDLNLFEFNKKIIFERLTYIIKNYGSEQEIVVLVSNLINNINLNYQ